MENDQANKELKHLVDQLGSSQKETEVCMD